MERVTVRVRGRVQMVGYRVFAEMAAERIGGIVGMVRNLPDGSTVEVVAEGQRPALDELLEELRVGPAHALVRGVDVEWNVAEGGFDRFRTIY
ncbi:MAG: acylphosphatase [Chloroflexi bacterium]|nr:acylphosphatase [Chloroflexota bacterium]MCY3697730.1 acylphosphatase [Chloroflexota bacterium]MXX32921.1 acylphosphatase [Chloroflexota bacterium]MXX81753.1 acylphosphatase [Chloroflexota bacterium]MYB21921.1 acylphosphatase [Chloroflexota bacterium]